MFKKSYGCNTSTEFEEKYIKLFSKITKITKNPQLSKSGQLIQTHDYQMKTQIIKSHHITLWKRVTAKQSWSSPWRRIEAAAIQIHSFLTLCALDGCERSTSRSDRLTPANEPGTHWIKNTGWVPQPVCIR
jgi:hypothetical protein